MHMRRWRNVLVGLLAITSLPSSASQTPRGQATCESARPISLLSVVGPMLGSHPAWLVDGSASWMGAGVPVKTLWVVAQSNQRIEIAGRLRGGSETARFRRGSDTIADTLIIENPRRESVIPGGATADLLREYAFIPSHVFYPVPGCWEFTVSISGAQHRLVRSVETRP